MQETDKILERLTKKINEIDEQLNSVNCCSTNKQDKLVLDFNETEKSLETKLRVLEQRESELNELNAQLEIQKKDLDDNSKTIQSQCRWYENQMKFLFCRDFIYEIVYKIEKDSIENEEKKLLQTKISSIQTFEKIGKNLKNFEDLKKKFVKEGKIFKEIQKKNYNKGNNENSEAGKRSSSEKFVKVGCRKGNLTPCLSGCTEKFVMKKDRNQFREAIDYLRKNLNKF